MSSPAVIQGKAWSDSDCGRVQFRPLPSNNGTKAYNVSLQCKLMCGLHMAYKIHQ